ncbi:hypothetical protein ABE42_39545 [Bacillus thuringiensis]|nr:hypothetical protein [Bacillus thuringiensis]
MNPQVFIETRNGRNYAVIVFGATPQDEGSEVAIALSPVEYAILSAAEFPPRPTPGTQSR